MRATHSLKHKKMDPFNKNPVNYMREFHYTVGYVLSVEQHCATLDQR